MHHDAWECVRHHVSEKEEDDEDDDDDGVDGDDDDDLIHQNSDQSRADRSSGMKD